MGVDTANSYPSDVAKASAEPNQHHEVCGWLPSVGLSLFCTLGMNRSWRVK